MRTSEWIQTVFVAVLAAAAWATVLTPHPLPMCRRAGSSPALPPWPPAKLLVVFLASYRHLPL